MSRYLRTYGIVRRQFHRTFKPLMTFGLLQARQALSTAGLLADNVFFPGFRRKPLDRPVFIIGNPRSGTTFLHKLLASTGELGGFELWEMMFPAITTRKLLAPFVGRMGALSPAKHHASEAHATSLHDLETDDLLEFLNFFDGGFLWSYFISWDDEWGSEECRHYFEPSLRSKNYHERFYRYIEGCWRRNMYYKNVSRIVVKSSMMTLRIEELVKRYPDCKIIYAVRDPRETIPSGMSLLSGVLDRAYGAFDRADAAAIRRFNENLYRASCQLYMRFDEIKTRGGIPEQQLLVVPFPQLMGELEEMSAKLLDFIEIRPSRAYEATIAEKAKNQRSFRSGHAYSLEKFGLDEDRIKRDLAFVYDCYDVAPAHSS